jgi:ATP-dependent protease ClpP protease subunit
MKTMYLNGIVGLDITADEIRSQVNGASKEKLQVIVNSPGGFVIDAFEIYNIFATYTGEVEFVINGMAASAMSYIIMSGDKISAFKNSIFMAHRAQAIGIGDADEIQREADIARAMDNVLSEAYSKKMKKPKEEILSEMKNEIWLIGWEALTNAGIIDNVIDSADEIDIPDEDKKQEIMFIDSELAKCGEPEKKKRAELKIIECQNRMSRDADRITKNKNKAAALLGNISTQKPIEKPVENNIIAEEKMNLQDFLKSNPEAQAELDILLATAEQKGIDSVKAEYSNDRKRIANILELSGVKLPDSTIEAIENNIDEGEFAKQELMRQKEIRAEKKESVFANIRIDSAQTPGAQAPAVVAQADDFDSEKMKSNVKNAISAIGGI